MGDVSKQNRSGTSWYGDNTTAGRKLDKWGWAIGIKASDEMKLLFVPDIAAKSLVQMDDDD